MITHRVWPDRIDDAIEGVRRGGTGQCAVAMHEPSPVFRAVEERRAVVGG